MRIKNPRIRSCAILQRFRCFFLFFLAAKFVLFTFEKIHFSCIFSKVNKKKLATEKLKLPSESLDNFASCHAAVLKLRKVSLFFY